RHPAQGLRQGAPAARCRAARSRQARRGRRRPHGARARRVRREGQGRRGRAAPAPRAGCQGPCGAPRARLGALRVGCARAGDRRVARPGEARPRMERAGRPQAAAQILRGDGSDRSADRGDAKAALLDPVLMSGSPFAPDFAQLPKALPIFPLTGVLLLPGGRLPLNIFEPRYLAMTRDALGEARMIGMVQPTQGHGDAGDPPVYRRGCAGRMTSWSETDDGRYLITLIGVARFDIVEELPRDDRLYRRVLADWSPYRGDLAAESAPLAVAERERLLAAIKPFFDRH